MRRTSGLALGLVLGAMVGVGEDGRTLDGIAKGDNTAEGGAKFE